MFRLPEMLTGKDSASRKREYRCQRGKIFSATKKTPSVKVPAEGCIAGKNELCGYQSTTVSTV